MLFSEFQSQLASARHIGMVENIYKQFKGQVVANLEFAKSVLAPKGSGVRFDANDKGAFSISLGEADQPYGGVICNIAVTPNCVEITVLLEDIDRPEARVVLKKITLNSSASIAQATLIAMGQHESARIMEAV